jgi:hypothetical protein
MTTHRVYYMTTAQHALSNLEHRRLKIAEFADMNDPFECLAVEMSNKHLRRGFTAVKENLEKKRGAVCFSRGYRNPVLWSHYADKHRGVCLGFNVKKELLGPISYDGKRLAAVLETLVGGDEAAKLEAVRRVLTTKYEDWRYEDEMRLFASLDERDTATGLCFAEFSAELQLAEVLLGQRFNGNLDRFRDVLAKGYPGVRAQQMRLAFRSFAVVHSLKHLKKRKPAGRSEE